MGFAWTASQGGERVAVLALARPMDAGQVLTGRDLVAVMVPPGTGLAVWPAARESEVLGQRVGQALWPGALLSRQALAGPQPQAGSAVVALSVKAGRYPQTLTAGQVVEVFDAGTGTSGGGAQPASPVRALVLAVSGDDGEYAPGSGGDAAGSGGSAVVLVRADEQGAGRLAVAADPALVQVAGGE
ncbi:hypothetical protein [Streptacidiphilus monticola]|uniref:SAF domain-containing protein n=1 Tax=Streptacidiphilus monticola TaxID=2161674 RepID=A0ABW1G918_9ACTN